MKTGITRRIDELGRIVIPKEIRKNMHIKKGELLEIYVSDNETISLKKHTLINKNEEILKCFIDSLSKKMKANVYVTDLNKIVFSNNNKYVDKLISEEVENLISNGVNINNLSELKLCKDLVIKSPLSVYPIYPNADISGLIIFEYSDKISKEYELLSSFTSLFLTDFLEVN